jgi:hypothetical protein
MPAHRMAGVTTDDTSSSEGWIHAPQSASQRSLAAPSRNVRLASLADQTAFNSMKVRSSRVLSFVYFVDPGVRPTAQAETHPSSESDRHRKLYVPFILRDVPFISPTKIGNRSIVCTGAFSLASTHHPSTGLLFISPRREDIHLPTRLVHAQAARRRSHLPSSFSPCSSS